MQWLAISVAAANTSFHASFLFLKIRDGDVPAATVYLFGALGSLWLWWWVS